MRRRLAVELCESLATIHVAEVDVARLPAAVVPPPELRPGHSQTRAWAEMADRQNDADALLLMAAWWLIENAPPAPARQCLVHGDFRPANVLVDSARISAILDWELAHLGDPIEDVGWYCCPAYRSDHFIPDAWEEKDFLRHYEQTSGITVSAAALMYWKVFSIFKLTVIAEAEVHAFREGTSSRVVGPASSLRKMLADIVLTADPRLDEMH